MKDDYMVKCAYVTRMLIGWKVTTWCMNLYDERYVGTGIRGFICILKARGYSSISFVSLRVPWTYLV